MREPESADDFSRNTAEEYTSTLTIKNAQKLTECAEKLTSKIERLEDPASFQVALTQLQSVE